MNMKVKFDVGEMSEEEENSIIESNRRKYKGKVF